jgi:WD40 repeat protein
MNSIDKLIRLWDSPSEVVAREVAGREARVSLVAFAPDGKTLFSGDAEAVASVAFFLSFHIDG